jgi:hypothetical protein
VDHGSDAERFDLVVIAEGFTTAEQDRFAALAQEFADYVLDTPPFSYNCSAINIWRIDVTSTQSGADDPSDCDEGTGAKVDTFFDATFCADGANRRLLRVDEKRVFDALNDQVPGWDQAMVLVNSGIYGGSGGGLAVGSTSGRWQRIAIHEIGHAAFGLADEYPYWAGCETDLDRDVHPDVEPVEPNVTTVSEREAIKWSALIDSETPVPTTENDDCESCDTQDDPNPGETVVGLYEGAHYYHCDGYRPAFNGMMRNYGEFCPVCTARIVETLAPFQPENSAPVCDAGGPYVEECAGEATEVMLDGRQSSDADCDMLEYAWSGEFEGDTAQGDVVDVEFAGVGEFAVSLQVSDGEASAECETTATVEDTIAPEVSVEDVIEECASPDGTPVELGVPLVEDICDADPVVANDAPDLFDLGDTDVEWTATDASDNVGSAIQVVTIEDTIAPVITVENVTAECTSPDGTPVDLGVPLVEDVCDADPAVANDAPELFDLGETEVEWTATDASDNVGNTTQLVTVEDTTPPDLVAPDDIEVECASPEGNEVDLGTPTVSDICDADVQVVNDAPDRFPLGETVVTWTATDASGNVSTDEQMVVVVDTTPPELAMSVSPNSIWPPNHKMVTIVASIEVSDICDAEPEVTLVSVVSNEPANGNGDGNTEPDIDGAEIGTDDREFRVRAERAGPGNGRIYTVTYGAEDDSDNTTPARDYIRVDHDQGNNH